MLLGLEILATTYIAKRFIDYRQSKKAKKNENAASKSLAVPLSDIGESEKQTNHYLKINIIAVGSGIIGTVYVPFRIISMLLTSYATVPILRTTEQSLFKDRKIKHDFLTSLVSVLTFALDQYVAAAVTSSIYHLGDKMVMKTKDRSDKLLNHTFKQQTTKVWLLTEKNHEIEVDIETIQAGDIVVINVGNTIPIDGIITNGQAMIDQHALTGEANLVEKNVGDQVLATTLLMSGRLCVKTEQAGAETTAAKVIEIIQQTSQFQSSIQTQGEKIADKIAYPLLGSALVLTPFIGISPAITLLFGSPGNPLKALLSIQTMNHLIFLSKQSVLVKDGRALEELIKVDTILFDKTGTLTLEQPIIGKIITVDDLNEQQLIHYAASAEQKLNHPIARAILQYAEKHQIELRNVDDSHYQMGYGINVQLDDDFVQVGSLRFMQLENIDVAPSILSAQLKSHTKGYSSVLIAVNGQVKGAIELKAQLRPNIQEVMSELRELGIQHFGIVSGDHELPTRHLAEQLNMDSYYANVLPKDKADIVLTLQQQGSKVCFIGDGINDSIALKQANVSISFSDASSMATDLAQIVLMDSNISHLPVLIQTCQQLSIDSQRILGILGSGFVVNTVSAIFLHMYVTLSAMLYVVEDGVTLAYTMRPLAKKRNNDEPKHSL